MLELFDGAIIRASAMARLWPLKSKYPSVQRIGTDAVQHLSQLSQLQGAQTSLRPGVGREGCGSGRGGDHSAFFADAGASAQKLFRLGGDTQGV